MGPTSSGSANDPHQSVVTEASITSAKVPAAVAGARQSSIRGKKSELASLGAGDRESLPWGGTGAASAQTPRPSRAEGAGSSKAAE